MASPTKYAARTLWTLPKIGFFAGLAAVLIAGGLATLSLISDHTESPAAATPSAERLTADQYHELVRGNIPTLADRSDAQLDRAAELSCRLFRKADYPDGWLLFIKTLTDSGLTGDEAGQLGPYVVYHACPELAGRLPSGGGS